MKLLYVMHNWAGYYHHGGTEIHAKNMVAALKRHADHQIYILFPDKRKADLAKIDSYLLLDTLTDTTESIRLRQPVTPECYRHDEWSNSITSLIARLRIDIVHFFHLLHFPLNLPLIAQQAGARTIVSCHDYFLVCQRYQLIKDNNFCGFPRISLKTCDLCLQDAYGYNPDSQLTRRHLISEVLYHADAVHYMCADQRARMLAAYPHLENHLELTMGVGLDRPPGENNQAKTKNSALPLQVSCVGNFDFQKGGSLLLEVIKLYLNSTHIQFNIFGVQRPPYGDRLRELGKAANVSLHGAYVPEQLPHLLANSDVALFASLWPETYVLALSETWSCGLVPVAPRLGAFGERITHGQNGFLFDLEDPGSLIHILNDLAQNPDKLNHCFQEIHHVKYPSISDNVHQYLSLYDQAMKRNDLNRTERISRLQLTSHPQTWATFRYPPVAGHPLYQAWEHYRRAGLKPTTNRAYQSLKYRLRKGVGLMSN